MSQLPLFSPAPTFPEFNPRFVAYARSEGLGPYEVLERDREKWPGGIMAGFVLWMSERWQTWDREHGYGRDHARSAEEHAAFDAWIGAAS